MCYVYWSGCQSDNSSIHQIRCKKEKVNATLYGTSCAFKHFVTNNVNKITINIECFLICRHGLHENWYTTTVFVLHLAVCDILYCSINLPFYAHVYFGYEWRFGEWWCVGSVILAFIFSYADWMALALIAFSRAMSLFFPNFMLRFGSKRNASLVIMSAWILVIVLMTPAFLEVVPLIQYHEFSIANNG